MLCEVTIAMDAAINKCSYQRIERFTVDQSTQSGVEGKLLGTEQGSQEENPRDAELE